MNSDPTNAIAGPSNSRASPLPSSQTTTPQLFFPPPAPPQTHPSHLSSTQDLLARFCLLPAYDRYVRPFAAPAETGLDQIGPVPYTPGVSGGLDKGKGREVADTPGGAVDGGDGDDDDGGKGDRKKKNNYKHLIKGIPGKHSLKKDDYLSTMMQVPPKQRVSITQFDLKTQRDAFTVSLEGLKGWNPSALVLESAQAREDRKKRKEFKRLAKLQQAQSTANIRHPQPIQAPIPTPAAATTTSFHRTAVTSTPAQNNTPRPGSTTAAPGAPGSTGQRPSSTVPRPGSTVSTSAPARPVSAVPRPSSTVPRPGSNKPTLPPVHMPAGRTGPGTPLRSAGTVTPITASAAQNHYVYPIDQDKRGKKRDRDRDESTGAVVNGPPIVAVNGGLQPNPAKPVVNAKAGVSGIRPRPIKKQRMDLQGQAKDVTITQQPTPQGV